MADTSNGPVAPTASAIAALRPLGTDAVRLDPAGLLGGWQARNARDTIPHCVDRLDQAGNLHNLRRVTGEVDGGFRGMWFADSDVYKTLEAASWQLAREPGDEAAREFVAGTAALLEKAQDPDGYLNSHFQVDHRDRQWRELRWSHELYCAGHLIQAGVAAARAGLGEYLLPLVRRFADLLVDRFGPGKADAVDGHPVIETALVELYRVTGHRPYLELAGRFIDLRGHGLLGVDTFGPQYYQDHEPIRAATEATGHAVRQLYLLAGAVDVGVETGDRALLEAAERLWDSAFNTKTYLTGSHGSRHRDEAFGDPYELPPDRAYAESCAAIASFHWNWRMLLATGGHRYADEMERVLHNGIAASTALDGRHFFYSNPLQLRTGHDGSNEDAPGSRLSWYTCSCCPPNLARLMASLQSYVATVDETGIQVHLYAAGEVRGETGRVEVGTRYPWDGRIAVTVAESADKPWTLALRIPGWCTGFTVDGAPAEPSGGYARLTRRWSAGDTVVLELDMPPRVITAHPEVDAVRGCVALARGPLVYCLEQADQPAGAKLERIRLDPAELAVADGDGPVPVVIEAGARVIEPASDDLYGPPGQVIGRPVRTVAVPYFLWGNREPGAMRVWVPTT